MTRIIAGFAGSRTIAVPRTGTRPTSDRVREAIFSALEARGVIDGAAVLDLYAGSGALGLETASRGAERVTLVESSSTAAAICRRNATIVTSAAPASARPRIDVVARTVASFLAGAGGAHDIVFLDPPYDLSEAALASDLSALVEHLGDNAIIIVERSSRSPEPTWPAGIAPERSRAYGETMLWWASAIPGSPTVPIP